MGVTYKQIEEMIEIGTTDKEAKTKIIEKFRNSKHKRRPIPKYVFDRKNYLLDNEKE